MMRCKLCSRPTAVIYTVRLALHLLRRRTFVTSWASERCIPRSSQASGELLEVHRVVPVPSRLQMLDGP